MGGVYFAQCGNQSTVVGGWRGNVAKTTNWVVGVCERRGPQRRETINKNVTLLGEVCACSDLVRLNVADAETDMLRYVWPNATWHRMRERRPSGIESRLSHFGCALTDLGHGLWLEE